MEACAWRGIQRSSRGISFAAAASSASFSAILTGENHETAVLLG
jgi:hypothetical protein